MSSKFSNKFLIPVNFPKILHDFIRETIRYQPKDIIDFSIQYFYYQEKLLPLKYVEGDSNNIIKESASIKKETHDRMKSNEYSDKSSNFTTNNQFYNKNQINPLDVSKIDKQIEEIDDEQGKSSDRHRSQNNKSHTTFSGISAEEFEKKDTRRFVNNIFMESKNNLLNNNNNKNSNENLNSTFSGISATDSEKNEVRKYVDRVFSDSILNVKEMMENKK